MNVEERTNNDQSKSAILGLEIVPPTEEACRLVMGWRNDTDSLRNSFDTSAKEWPGFYEEFREGYFVDPSLPCLFVLKNGKRVGFIRFRRLSFLVENKSACDISIMLAPEERGIGIAASAIALCLQIPRNGRVDALVADIKATNIASIKTFERAEFSFLGDVVRQIPSGSTVEVKRFVKSLTANAALGTLSKFIGPGHPCFIIAEAGSNWRMGSAARDLRMAKTLIDVAVEAGADAVKFQTYRPKTTYVQNAGTSDYLSESGINDSIMDIFADLTMPYEMLPELSHYASQQKIQFMSSPFSVDDFNAVDPHVQVHKIASYEISHLRLIAAAAKSSKVTIISTGASDVCDIEWAVQYFQSMSKSTLCLMQCTARYPASPGSLNLGTIPFLKAKFGLPVGLSDHSRHPTIAPVAAIALGANLIEKHYTLDNRLPGPDHAFALTAKELKSMVNAIRQAELVVGTGCKHIQPEEDELFAYARRGLQAIKTISEGERLIEGVNFDILRPGKQKRGAHPRIIDKSEGLKSRRKISVGDGLQLEDIEFNS